MGIRKPILYKKIFLTYIVVIVGLIVGFDLYLINYAKSNSIDSRMHLAEWLALDICEVLKEIENSNRLIVNEMYYDPVLTKDIITFLEYETNDYLKNKLDLFSSSNNFTYSGIEKFVSRAFLGSDNIDQIVFISKSLEELRAFNEFNQIHMKKIKNYNEEIKLLPHIFFKENNLYFTNVINNPDTLAEEGKIIISYNLSNLNSIISNYGVNYGISILDGTDQKIYTSKEGIDSISERQLSELKELSDYDSIDINRHTTVFKVDLSNNLMMIVEISLKNLLESQKVLYSSIFFLDFILIILSVVILKFRLDKLAKRLNQILKVMDKVKEGNFKSKIPTDNESDEISYISQYFNQMCVELDKYINKSYLAEVNQKKAEMIALQNQINPHFLYNTLECIRMKAICNGDKDVGNMLYNLSFLFRKQLKDSNLITIKSELEYCRRYMEIFEFRYREKFTFSINCSDELLDNEIIKFTLQPLIENYFIHGIKLEGTNNYIQINVIKEDHSIKILIDDNGKGISEDKLIEINENLSGELQENIDNQSIGIVNAHARIVGTYGKYYGIKVENNDQGARIIVQIPVTRGGKQS